VKDPVATAAPTQESPDVIALRRWKVGPHTSRLYLNCTLPIVGRVPQAHVVMDAGLSDETSLRLAYWVAQVCNADARDHRRVV
jgi:hypothetical protein